MRALFDRLVEKYPAAVMVRGAMENILSQEFLDGLFERHAQRQCERKLLFSTIVEMMCLVVCRMTPSINAGYQLLRDSITVSVKSVYNKINKVEPYVSRALVRETAQRMSEVLKSLRVRWPSPIPGFRVRILDGNHHPASEHRLKKLRNVAAAPLPATSLVVYNPETQLVEDVIPCEDAHRQERLILTELLQQIEPGVVWIADRNFCTATFLFELSLHGAYFVVRRHAQLPCQELGPRKRRGRTETGVIYEQKVRLRDANGETLECRQITIELDTKTRDGDRVLRIFTNLPAHRVSARTVANAYRDRWEIEAVNAQLVRYLDSEQTRLGNPPATLFAFCLSLVAFNLMTLVQGALRAAHGAQQTDDRVSNYHLAHQVRFAWAGTELVDDAQWEKKFADLTPAQLARQLKDLAKTVNLQQLRKAIRGPKKPRTRRTRYKHTPHVATYRILHRAKPAS